MTQLTENVFSVEVPSMAFGLMVNNYGNESELMYMLSMEDIADDDNTEETLITKKLPAGSWQFICTTKDITEEQARGIVGSSEWYFPERHIRYIDYNHLVGPDGKQAWNIGFSNALLSLRSLLTSKGLDVNKNYALLKKGGAT